MTAIFGRNADTASGPLGDMPISADRYSTLADAQGDLAVYDSHTGLFAPFYGDTARFVARDFNQGTANPDDFQWKDTLA